MGLQIFDELVPLNASHHMTDGGTGHDYVFDGNSLADRRIDWILLSNTDAIDHTVSLFLDGGDGQIIFATVTVPAGAGSVGVPPVEFFAAAMPATVPGIVLVNGAQAGFFVNEAITPTFYVGFFASGGKL